MPALARDIGISSVCSCALVTPASQGHTQDTHTHTHTHAHTCTHNTCTKNKHTESMRTPKSKPCVHANRERARAREREAQGGEGGEEGKQSALCCQTDCQLCMPAVPAPTSAPPPAASAPPAPSFQLAHWFPPSLPPPSTQPPLTDPWSPPTLPPVRPAPPCASVALAALTCGKDAEEIVGAEEFVRGQESCALHGREVSARAPASGCAARARQCLQTYLAVALLLCRPHSIRI